MHQDRKTGQIDAVFRAINRLSTKVATGDYLNEELKSSGVDPDEFVNKVRARLDDRLSLGSGGTTQEARRFTLPLIGQLRKLTQLSPNEMARRLEVPLAFLSAIERHLEVTPSSWRLELARRVELAFQISKDLALAIFETQSRLEVTNLHQSSSDGQLTHEDILDMSQMDESSRQFWRLRHCYSLYPRSGHRARPWLPRCNRKERTRSTPSESMSSSEPRRRLIIIIEVDPRPSDSRSLGDGVCGDAPDAG